LKLAIITVGLGFGDEGKGQTTAFLCKHLKPSYVVRYSGGPQCGHNVVASDGRKHCFSQFGAGSFEGVPTYIGPKVIIDPLAMAHEAEHLLALGVDVESDIPIRVHGSCLITTDYHQRLNRAREVMRGAGAQHGSCGRGIGETRDYANRFGQHAIVAHDMFDHKVLLEKLERLARYTEEELAKIDAPTLLPAPLRVAEDLEDRGWPFDGGPLPPCDTAIFEGAQGVLLDEWHGFYPHTTWSTVTDKHAREMAEEAKAQRIYTLGVTRAFTTRHGAGPLPTYDVELTKRLRDVNNPFNTWQGDFRVGHIDLPLLRYAIASCGPIHGLAVSWLDHFVEGPVGVDYHGSLPISRPYPSIDMQRIQGEALQHAIPLYARMSRYELLDRLGRDMAPVVLGGYGPTSEERGGPLLSLLKPKELTRGQPTPVA
jgi:adenylosuccinate synthase